MSQPRVLSLAHKWNLRFAPLGLLFGIVFALFICGYWLAELFPPTSRQLIALTGLLAILGAAFYFAMWNWLWPLLRSLSRTGRALTAVSSVLAGIALLFGGTAGWQDPARYVTFLLPSHRLEVTASGAAAGSGIALDWFSTSLGDVSYDSMHLQGWKRAGDQLVLQDPAANSLEWTGKTGGSVELVWHKSGADALQLSWDGQAESIGVSSGKFTYSHAFAVPWYASRAFVLVLGALFFGSLVLALILLLWSQRARLFPTLRAAFTPTASKWDWRDSALLAGAAILALLLRLPNLGVPFPAVDEYFHLIAARQIAEGAAFGSVYQRGLWLVTMPVSLFLRMLGYQLWAARLPGVLFNVLALWPLYLLARRLNRAVAVLSTVLYATSPWIITFARIAREYAYYPFYFYWIILGMLVFISAIPEGFVLLRDWRLVLTRHTILTGLALIVPPLFALYGDRLSTFRTILIAYLVFGLFILARFDFRNRSNWPFLGALGIGFLVTAMAWFERQKTKIVSVAAFNSVPVSYFLPDPQQQWYYNRLVPLLLLALIGAALCCFLLRRTNVVPLFMFGLYAVYITFFAFLSKTFFHTRHVLTTELWYVILVATALYLLWRVAASLIRWKGSYGNAVLAVLLGLSMINVRQVVVPVTSTNPDDPISEDYLHDMSQVHAFMLGHAQPHDVLISTVYGLYSSWQEAPEFRERYRITTDTPRDQIFGLVADNQSGWIVIDQIRLAMSTLGPNEFAGNPDVEYIGLFGDQSVWHWQHASGGLGSTLVAGKGK